MWKRAEKDVVCGMGLAEIVQVHTWCEESVCAHPGTTGDDLVFLAVGSGRKGVQEMAMA